MIMDKIFILFTCFSRISSSLKFMCTLKIQVFFLVIFYTNQSLAYNSNLAITTQQLNVKGKITDDKGSPLESVTVSIKNSDARTVSDLNGLYEINVPIG